MTHDFRMKNDRDVAFWACAKRPRGGSDRYGVASGGCDCGAGCSGERWKDPKMTRDQIQRPHGASDEDQIATGRAAMKAVDRLMDLADAYANAAGAVDAGVGPSAAEVEAREHLEAALRMDYEEFGAVLADADAARKRVAELEALLREALELYNAAEVAGSTREDVARIVAIGKLLDPPWLPSWERPASDFAIDKVYNVFIALREQLLQADVCLACGEHRPGSSCQCENDE